jgi:hypothetical protein
MHAVKTATDQNCRLPTGAWPSPSSETGLALPLLVGCGRVGYGGIRGCLLLL